MTKAKTPEQNRQHATEQHPEHTKTELDTWLKYKGKQAKRDNEGSG